MNIIEPILFFLFSQFATQSVGGNTVTQNYLASEQISLEKRYDNKFVNDVFKDNILLNLSYLGGKVTKREDIVWEDVNKSFSYSFKLLPGKTFTFHEDVLPKYVDSLVKTTNAHFNYDDGFKSDGYLMGDGVCHFASLIYWVAKEAGLDAYAPANHDFAVIPEIDKEYGVAIYMMPGNSNANAMQNLYVTNNKENAVIFEFDYKNGELKLSISEIVKPAL
ncbi:MAG: VanW family protein [Candidatus Levybacteria bacterium]|nr:VanW family protein [Candidatus Levybacteria bacterium]